MAIFNQKGGKYNTDTISIISKEVGLSEKLVREIILCTHNNLSFVDFYVKYYDEDAE